MKNLKLELKINKDKLTLQQWEAILDEVAKAVPENLLKSLNAFPIMENGKSIGWCYIDYNSTY